MSDYGNGIVMGVPAHDAWDANFANMNGIIGKKVISKDGVLQHSQKYNGLSIDSATEEMIKDGLGVSVTEFWMKDWCVSRQRYWGVPVPMIICESCGTIPVPESELPVKLPKLTDTNLLTTNALQQIPSFLNCKCPKCNQDAKRDTDTLDTFVDSSWYFLWFLDSSNSSSYAASKLANHWMPVDIYIGGMEHAIMHLLYARFIHKSICDGYPSLHREPFKELIT